jgi:hypothetical protein
MMTNASFLGISTSFDSIYDTLIVILQEIRRFDQILLYEKASIIFLSSFACSTVYFM